MLYGSIKFPRENCVFSATAITGSSRRPSSGTGWLFLSLAFLICINCEASPAAPAQSYQRIAQCTANNNAQTEALQRQQWALLVSSARWYLTNCRDLLEGDAEALTLSMIGTGLTQQGNFDDAVPVLVRCVTIKPDAAYCFEVLGEALA